MKKFELEFFKKVNYPVSVRKQKGVIGAETLCGNNGALRLTAESYVIYDMGAPSVGGYPAFEVASFEGRPVVHISYSDRMIPYLKESSMAKGDFTRGSCTYLGVELPVMPANPYRFEAYTIQRVGLFLYPLIQGQERFVYITVSGGNVVLKNFYIIDDSAPETPIGSFSSDNPALDRVWLASARTSRLATVRANQWESVCGRLCLRKLTKWHNGAIYRDASLREIRLQCKFELSRNPEHETGIGLLFFARSAEEGYLLRLTENGELRLEELNGDHSELLTTSYAEPIADNMPQDFELIADCAGARVFLNGQEVLCYDKALRTGGSFGFWMEPEWRALVDDLSVASGKKAVFAWQGDLTGFDIRKSGYFISDGAKRDRLPWTGDLDWAFENGWYSFGEKMDALNTLRILARHQTPEGFVFATCYPENLIAPETGDYGDYQSDMFACWFVIDVLTYYKLSGDEQVKELYPTMTRCMDYLWKFVDSEDGLFDQRYETSKGLWDHYLGDTGKNTYTNLIILDAFEKLADYSELLGDAVSAEKYREHASAMRKGVFAYLYDEERGGFVKRKDWRELCDMANPYAMGKHMVSQAQAAKIAAQVRQATKAYGKVTVLMIKGLYDYGFSDLAEELLTGKLPLYQNGALFSVVDWFSIVDNKDMPETVYECMHNPPCNFGDNLNWGDLSHPDSGLCGVISSRIAGVMPLSTGFAEVLIRPNIGKCKEVHCRVPVSGGAEIAVDIWTDENGSRVNVTAPESIRVETDFSNLVQPVTADLRCSGSKIKIKEVI